MKNLIIGIAAAAVVTLVLFKVLRPSVEGNWTADYVIDNGSDTLAIDSNIISLDIDGDAYSFGSTLNQTQSGVIKRKSSNLILNPQQGSPYKVVVEELSKGKLILSMDNAGITRKLVMRRSD